MSKTKKIKVSYCDGKKCKRKNEALKIYLKKLVKSKDNGVKVKVKKTKCQHLCKMAPLVCLKKQLCFGFDQVEALDNLIKVK